MKKISLILALTLVLVSAFAAVALADPSNPNNAGINPATNPFSDGTPGAVYLPGGDIHSNYAANTDACAACHATHTGNGANLIQWAYAKEADVCMICHDGTVTKTYNVVAGKVADTGTNSSAGLFAVKNDGAGNLSASEHAVFSGVNVSAAFGGAVGATAPDGKGQWNAEFSCVSCHTPHGQGGNARILEPNPNWVQTGGKDPSTVDASGNYYKGIYNAILGTANGTVTKFYFNTATVDANTKDYAGNAVTAINATNNVPIVGHRLFKPTIFVGGVKQTTGYRFSFDPGTKNAYVLFTTAPAAGTITANYIPVLQVNMTVQNKLTAAEKVVGNSYVGMNYFCGACHTDYNTSKLEALAQAGDQTKAPYNVANGTYSMKTRHGVGGETVKFAPLQPSENNKLSCITCHYAHGVDQNRWAATASDPLVNIAAYNSPETAGSSRLKRLPNMGVCEVCHQKGVDSYSANNATNW